MLVQSMLQHMPVVLPANSDAFVVSRLVVLVQSMLLHTKLRSGNMSTEHKQTAHGVLNPNSCFTHSALCLVVLPAKTAANNFSSYCLLTPGMSPKDKTCN